MWSQFINSALGIWLISASAVLGYGGAAQVNDRVVGPFIATLAWVAIGECTRSMRLWNVPLAAWLIISPFILGAPPQAMINCTLVGIIVFALSFVRGKIARRYGGGWAMLFRKSADTPPPTTSSE